MVGTEVGGSTGIKEHKIEQPSWFYRRILIYSTLGLDAAILIAIIIGWFLNLKENVAIQIIAGGILFRSMAILGSYVFNATWQDINLAKIVGSKFGGMSSVIEGVVDGQSTRRI